MFSCTWKYFARLHSDEPLENHNKTSVLDEIHAYSYELSTKERVHHLNENNLWFVVPVKRRDPRIKCVFWFVSMFFVFLITQTNTKTSCIKTKKVILVAMMEKNHQSTRDLGWLNLVRLSHFPSFSLSIFDNAAFWEDYMVWSHFIWTPLHSEEMLQLFISYYLICHHPFLKSNF